MISANMRTEELLQQSQSLTQELQSQSKELTQQQDELKRTNAELEKQAIELEDKAKLLEEQNTKVEVKNHEVEQARVSLEEKAEQLSLISKYKSEFLANMSHELRTPLNSLLILAKMLVRQPGGEPDAQAGQVRQDDLRVGRRPADADQRDPRPVQGRGRQDAGRAARRRARRGRATTSSRRSAPWPSRRASTSRSRSTTDLPAHIHTDPQRLQQVLKNLLANAFKFTDARHGDAAHAPAQAGHALRRTRRCSDARACIALLGRRHRHRHRRATSRS